jgi:hypothetical protein
VTLISVLQTILYLFLGFAGLVLFGISAYGSIRFRPLHSERVLTFKQRFQFAFYGLLLVAVAWIQLTGVA